MSDGISNKQYVGVHLSVIVRIDERGQKLDCVQIDNDPKASVSRFVRPAGVRRSRWAAPNRGGIPAVVHGERRLTVPGLID